MIARRPTLGLEGRVDILDLDPRHAASGTQNVLLQNGVVKTPYGFTNWATSSALTAGEILFLGGFKELDGTGHRMAVTTTKIYDYDSVNGEWDDRTGTALDAVLGSPVSMVAIAHDDTDIYLDNDSGKANAYHHVVVCDGGLSDIQRWAGKYETNFLDLTGGGGYHGGTTHRALQVGAFRSRLILISPQDYDAPVWTANNQRVRWPAVGKLQTWSGTGSGFVDLIDTGGINVWSERLGGSYYVYQNNSIWDLRYVGGTQVFDPYPVVETTGALSNHLIVTSGSVHYFVGDDYNVYIYYGGSAIQSIGDPIRDKLESEIEKDRVNQAWLVMGENRKILWLYFVEDGSTYITRAFGYDLQDKSWTTRDFMNSYSTTSGLTAIALLESDSYQTGDSYQEAIDTNSLYDISDGDYTSQLYGNELEGSQRTLSVDSTEVTWCAGGLEFFSACTDVTWTADFTVNDILKVHDGSGFTNTRFGTHYYTFESVGSNCASLISSDPSLAVSDTTNVPADVSWTAWAPVGDTYNQEIETVPTEPVIVLGDDSGYVYRSSNTATTEDGNSIASRFLTKIFNGNLPDVRKRWPGLRVMAKENTSGNGALLVSYRTQNFDTSETGWTAFTERALTSQMRPYRFPMNVSAEQIQFKFQDSSGYDFVIREFIVENPVEVVDR